MWWLGFGASQNGTQNIPRFWWLGFGALGNLYKSIQSNSLAKKLAKIQTTKSQRGSMDSPWLGFRPGGDLIRRIYFLGTSMLFAR